MQATSRRWPLLRMALLAATTIAVCVGVCVVAHASSRSPAASTLVGFTGLWYNDDQTGYDEQEGQEAVVRDSVVGHAQRQLNILRGHLNRQASLVFVLLPISASANSDGQNS